MLKLRVGERKYLGAPCLFVILSHRNIPLGELRTGLWMDMG